MMNEAWFYNQVESPTPTLHNTTDNDPDLRASSDMEKKVEESVNVRPQETSVKLIQSTEDNNVTFKEQECQIGLTTDKLVRGMEMENMTKKTVRFTGSPSSADGDVISDRPDLSFRCEECDVHVDLRHLQEHRQYHTALNVMKYKPTTLPSTVPKLMQRRRQILKRLKSKIDSEKPIEPNVVQQINEAYELLKSYLEETFECFRRIKETVITDVEGYAVNSSVEGILAVGLCSSANERWKSQMEDAQTFVDEFGGDPDKAFLGLYDGHHGKYAAATSAVELHHALLYHMAQFDPKVKWNEIVAGKMHSVHNPEETWIKQGSLLEDEVRTPPEDGVCTIQLVIKGHEEKQERLKQERLKEAKDDTDKENVEAKGPAMSKKSARKKKYGNAYSEHLQQAFSKAYMYTDLLLSWGKAELSKVRWSGCSALTCIIENTGFLGEEVFKVNLHDCSTRRESMKTVVEPNELARLHLAHAGNVQCLLIRGNLPYRLTKDHTANNPKEKSRIEKLGGTVSESDRDLLVNGVMSGTHGLGNHGDVLLKRCVPHEPYTTVVPIDQYCQLIIMATHGVWEVFSDEEASKLLTEMLPCNQVAPPSRLETSIQYLLAAKSRNHSIDTSHVPASELFDRLRAYSSMTAASVPLPEHLRASPEVKRRSIAANDSLRQLPEQSDLRTELSDHDHYSNDEDHVGNESGNEADLETNIDHLTIPPVSRMSLGPPTQEEVHREFAKLLAERLVQAAILAGSKDNVSVTVVLLPGCGI